MSLCPFIQQAFIQVYLLGIHTIYIAFIQVYLLGNTQEQVHRCFYNDERFDKEQVLLSALQRHEQGKQNQYLFYNKHVQDIMLNSFQALFHFTDQKLEHIKLSHHPKFPSMENGLLNGFKQNKTEQKILAKHTLTGSLVQVIYFFLSSPQVNFLHNESKSSETFPKQSSKCHPTRGTRNCPLICIKERYLYWCYCN